MTMLLTLALLAAEPVVWTPVADPDPGFVAPKVKASPRRAAKKTAAPPEPTTLEGAFVNLEQAVAEARQAAMKEEADKIEQQLKEAEEAIDRSRKAAEAAPNAEDAAPQD